MNNNIFQQLLQSQGQVPQKMTNFNTGLRQILGKVFLSKDT